MTSPASRPIGLILLLVVLSGLLSAPADAGMFSGIERLFRRWGVFQGLQLNGSNDFTLQQNLVQGSQSAYEGQRWDTEPFMRRSSLSVEGPIWKEFSFRADLSSSGYGTDYNRWVLGYVGHDTALYYGDLNIDLSGNQFASFAKPVRGWQLDQRIGKGLARMFYSQERAITRVQTFPGQNASGPFFLTYTPVIEGTEVVKINEEIQQFGVDYTLDYESGQLWFEVEGRPPKIVPDTATVSVSYQSAGQESLGSTLYGARLFMPLMNDRLQIGMTMLKQDRGNANTLRDTVGYQEDIFNGSGSTGPFDVNYRPIINNGTQVIFEGEQRTISQALLVLVDNVEQAEGVDYDSYRSIGRIIFRRSVPPTSLVVIRYYYDLSSTTPMTDNTIYGLDLIYHLNKNMDFQMEWGRSDGGLARNQGDALRLGLNYGTDRFRIASEYRDIAPTFAFMDSVGFYRQERGLDVGVNWEPIRHISLFARRSDVMTAQGYSFGYSGYGNYGNYGDYTTYSAAKKLALAQEATPTTGLDIHSLRNDFEVRFEFPNWPAFAFQHQQMNNTGGTSGDSTYDSNNFSFSYSPANLPFSFNATYYQTNQLYRSLTTSQTSSGLTGSKTDQLQWAATYRPSDKFAISYNQGRNKSIARDSTNRSNSSTDQLSLHWTPSSKLDFNFDITETSSLGTVSSGFYNDYYTYAAGIADGGIDGDDDDETDKTNRYTDSSSRFALRYTPTPKLNMDFSLTSRKYTSGGTSGYLADSNQTTGSVGLSYMFNENLSLNAAYSTDKMLFLEEGRGTVTNNTITAGANYRIPNTPWTFGLSYSQITGASPTYVGFGSSQRMHMVNNNMSDLQARIAYALGDGSELGLTAQLSDYAGGYSNFNRQTVDLAYSRRLSDVAQLRFGYRFSRNLSKGLDDPRYGNTSLTPVNQNYLANTFLLELSTQFSSSGSSSSLSGLGSGFGSSSLGNFGGYRTGTSMYGTTSGYGMNGMNSMGVFSQNPMGSGYTSPFGNTYSSIGGSSFSGGGFNGAGMGSTIGSGAYGSTRPQGYEVFGSGFRGSTGGFGSGLGDISGGTRPGGVGDLVPAAPAGASGADDDALLNLEDWYTLDDLYSIWW